MIKLSSNLDQFKRRIDDRVRRQMPFAVATALTQTARDIERAMVEHMDVALDKPTPFTKRGMIVRKATKTNLQALVGFKDVQARYLATQERGGTRKPKRKALVVPFNAKLNKYGNLPRGKIAKLLARQDTFSGVIKGVAGIWQRTRDGGVTLLVGYEQEARYDPRLGFVDLAKRVGKERLRPNFRTALRRAMETAR